MKALSLSQPYAELVVLGKKKIELRRWNTKFRGTFLVHAAKSTFPNEYEKFGFAPRSLQTGGIIGKADLIDVKHYESEDVWKSDQHLHLAGLDFIESTYGFILENAVKFERPIACKGQLNFFNVELQI